MRRILILAGTAAALTAGTGSATAAEVPPINCDPAACTYPIEKKVDAVQDCVEGAKRAIANILQGTPQPQECSLG
jgi:hypothetical protein